MCIYWPVEGSNLRKSHFRAVFFLFFWSPDPPLTHLIKAIWFFFVPLELCDILVINITLTLKSALYPSPGSFFLVFLVP